jgi:hypothetical protein
MMTGWTEIEKDFGAPPPSVLKDESTSRNIVLEWRNDVASSVRESW